MASFYNLTAVGFLLCCLTITFAQENSTSHQEGNNNSTLIRCNIDTKVERINETTRLTPNIDESEIKEVLSKYYNKTTIKCRQNMNLRG